MILVLIPKGNIDTWGIGLIELLRKVVEAIIEICLRTNVCIHRVVPAPDGIFISILTC